MKNLLFNYLKLAYSPISNYDFSIIKDDPIIKTYINTSSLYIIAQRPVLTFENFQIIPNNQIDPYISFEIHQKDSDKILHCKFDMFQPKLMNQDHQGLQIAINYIYPYQAQEKLPFNHLANFVIRSMAEDFFWFSPEKLLYHYLRDAVDVVIEGDIGRFLNYNIHYIGKATEQEVVTRLNGHSTLQEILSREEPLQFNSLPRDEIVLLFFSFEDNISLQSFDFDDDVSLAVNAILGVDQIPEKTIYLDAEKALINALKPKYNRQLYKSYPKSKDGLNAHRLDHYSYSFIDPIKLKYSDGTISGGYGLFDGDVIKIADDVVEIVKRKKCSE